MVFLNFLQNSVTNVPLCFSFCALSRSPEKLFKRFLRSSVGIGPPLKKIRECLFYYQGSMSTRRGISLSTENFECCSQSVIFCAC